MKPVVAGTALLILAGTAHAGSMADPVVEPVLSPVVVEEAAADSSAPSAALVLALMTIAVFGAAAAGN
ncbi:hypothetical protein [Pseudoponticoccus marisrubri]|uniref:Ferrochelatase n=1 Tax=Pseudoponticoccus marisrubri TaxID=1685382 RepID=A0A0W7WP34_9RHOB|nr:hypothetical protein [Pseudoponticoccus marisrubri]KUF12326.1 hypothetical protein AVJ23_00930 [Pseudoponticoccus marisrubri]